MKDKSAAFFEEARQQEPVMNLEEVALLIREKSTVPKYKWFNLKNTCIMIALSACLLAILLWPGKDPAPGRAPHAQTAVPHAPPALHPPSSLPAAKPHATRIPDDTAFVPSDAEEPALPPPVFSLPPISKVIEPGNSGSFFNASGYLELDQEQLAALGIVTDGSQLRYANRVDSVKLRSSSGESYRDYYCRVSPQGSTRIKAGGVLNKDTPETGLHFWPLLHTLINPDTQVTICRNNIEEISGHVYIRAVQPYLVPVYVKLTAMPGRHSTHTSHIFWFEPTEKFLAALPAAAAAEVRSRYNTEQSHRQARELELDFGRTIERLFDQEETARLRSRLTVVAKSEALSRLGFAGTGKDRLYRNRLHSGDSVFSISIRYVKHLVIDTEYDVPGSMQGNDGKPFYPVAISDRDFWHFTFIFPGIRGKVQQQQQFRASIDRLVPVEVKLGNRGYIFWFTDHPDLRSVLESSARKP